VFILKVQVPSRHNGKKDLGFLVETQESTFCLIIRLQVSGKMLDQGISAGGSATTEDGQP